MCGLFFSCSRDEHVYPSNCLRESLSKRGPDSTCTIRRAIRSNSGSSQETPSDEQKQSYSLAFLSTVLPLRGDSIVRQPQEDADSGSLLCWNGEAWKVGNEIIDGNDSQAVFNLFMKAIRPFKSSRCNTAASYSQSIQHTIDAIASISGPYAFVFYDAPHQRIFFGRDILGRRSLVMRNDLLGSITISSLCDCTGAGTWTEIEADGVYMLDLQKAPPSLHYEVESILSIPRLLGKSDKSMQYTLVRLSPFVTSLETLTNARQRHFRSSTMTSKAVQNRL